MVAVESSPGNHAERLAAAEADGGPGGQMPDEDQDDETGEPLLRDEGLARIRAIRARLDPPQLGAARGRTPARPAQDALVAPSRAPPLTREGAP